MLAGRWDCDNETIDLEGRPVGKFAGKSVDNNGYPQISTDRRRERLRIDCDASVIGLAHVLGMHERGRRSQS
jgi:hypothetical protein